MQISQSEKKTLEVFAPRIEHFSTKSRIWVGFLLLLIVIGIYALYIQIARGHGVTGMRDYVIWGVYIVNFIFFIGVSYAGAIIFGVLQIFKVPWRRPIVRLSAMLAVISAFIGPIYIILCIGRFDRLYHLFVYARLQSPIIWDVVAITTYLVGALLLLYLLLIRDFAIFRDAEFLNLSKWRRKLYRFLALNYEDTESQRRQLEISKNLIAILMVPMVVIVSSVLSWIFGMTLRPGWHSTIFGPYFVLASIFSGTAVIIVLMWIFRRIYSLKDYFQDRHFKYMGYIMLVMAAAYGYATFSEYLTNWYGSEEWDGQVVNKLFSYDQYGLVSMLSAVIGIVVPMIIVAVPKLRRPNLIAFASLLAILAMWVRRYLIIIPTLETPLLPIQDLRPEFAEYTATWVEWALTIAGLAAFALFFTLMAKFVTIFSVSEFAKKSKFESL